MQHAMVRAPESVAYEQPVGVADKVPVGEEEEFDEVEHWRGGGAFAKFRSIFHA
jgi:hypothetical protein